MDLTNEVNDLVKKNEELVVKFNNLGGSIQNASISQPSVDEKADCRYLRTQKNNLLTTRQHLKNENRKLSYQLEQMNRATTQPSNNNTRCSIIPFSKVLYYLQR